MVDRFVVARRGIFCVFIAVTLTTAGVTRPVAGNRCSKAEFPVSQPSFYFIGTATADTIAAGWAGALGVENVRADTMLQKLHGQFFDLERVGGSATRTMASPVRRAVVIPWGYLPDCRPIPWPRGLWQTPGVHGFVWGALRAQEHWVDGVPTIDMHMPYSLPYPGHGFSRNVESLTADELFDLVSVMPPLGTLDSLALQPLFRWARASPELARKYPAETAIRGLLHAIENERIRAIQPTFGGTWRFTLEMDGEQRVFFARTESHATTPHGREEGDAWRTELRPPIIDSYALWTVTAATPELLVATRSAPGGYLVASVSPITQADGTQLWRAGAELSLAARALPQDAALQSEHAAARTTMRDYIRDNLPPGSQAFFRVYPDGRATFEQVLVLGAGRTATLRGERISRETIPAPR